MQNQLLTWIVRGLVLLTAMPVHECAHGYVAYRLGDDTAARQGRLTLNPFVHLDLLGSLLLITSGFGWAKPVQINPRAFAKPRRDMAISALAGPVSNILLALVVMIISKLLTAFLFRGGMYGGNVSYVLQVLSFLLDNIVWINLCLAVFNLLPVPPLDGFKVFGAWMPDRYYFWVLKYELYISIALIALLWLNILDRPIIWIANALYALLNLLTRPLDLLLW